MQHFKIKLILLTKRFLSHTFIFENLCLKIKSFNLLNYVLILHFCIY